MSLPSEFPFGPSALGVKPTGHAGARTALLVPDHPLSEGFCLCPCFYPYFIWLLIKLPLTLPLTSTPSTLGRRID